LAAAACVRAPVCCGYGCGCGSEGAREGLARGLRGAKRLGLGARAWVEVLAGGLQQVGGLRGVAQADGGQGEGARQSQKG